MPDIAHKLLRHTMLIAGVVSIAAFAASCAPPAPPPPPQPIMAPAPPPPPPMPRPERYPGRIPGGERG